MYLSVSFKYKSRVNLMPGLHSAIATVPRAVVLATIILFQRVFTVSSNLVRVRLRVYVELDQLPPSVCCMILY